MPGRCGDADVVEPLVVKPKIAWSDGHRACALLAHFRLAPLGIDLPLDGPPGTGWHADPAGAGDDRPAHVRNRARSPRHFGF